MSLIQCLGCVCRRENEMAELAGALNCRHSASVSWALAEGGHALVRSYFSVSPAPPCLLVVSVECLVWKEALFHLLGHTFDLLSAFCFPFFLSLFLIPYCASLFSFPCSSQFSSPTFIPHRMRYVLPKRIRKSHERDHLLCCMGWCSYALLCFPQKSNK